MYNEKKEYLTRVIFMNFLSLLNSLLNMYLIGGNPFPVFDNEPLYELLNQRNIVSYEIKEVFSLNTGNPSILVFSDNETVFIYDTVSKSVEYSFDETIPYSTFLESDVENDLTFYCIDESCQFFSSDGEYFWEVGFYEYKVKVNDLFSELEGRGSGDSLDCFTPVSDSYVPETDMNVINNYQYFKKLRNRHAINPNSHCSLIAVEILMGYFDSFISDDFIFEKWDGVVHKAISFPTSWVDWNSSPGSGLFRPVDVDVKHELRDYLCDLMKQIGNPTIETLGASVSHVNSLLNSYITNSLGMLISDFSISSVTNSFINSSSANNLITSTIDSGYPLLICADNHWFVAFGYSDDYLLVHNGGGSWGLLDKEICFRWTFRHFPGVISVIPSLPHSHNNNYFSTTTKKFYCSCGVEQGHVVGVSNFIHNTIDFNQGPGIFSFKYCTRNINTVDSSSFLLNFNAELWIKPIDLFTGFAVSFSHNSNGVSLPKLKIELFDENYTLMSEASIYDYFEIDQTSGVIRTIGINIDINTKFLKLSKVGGLSDSISIYNLTFCA